MAIDDLTEAKNTAKTGAYSRHTIKKAAHRTPVKGSASILRMASVALG
jgi:hypothetical protein